MKVLTNVLVLLISLTLLSAQEKVDLNVVNQIMEHGLKKSKVMDLAWEMTDGNGPRLTNSKGLEKAQKWAMETLKSWGLKNVRLDEFGEFGKQWDIKSYSLELTEPYYERLIAYPKAWSGSTNGVVTGTPVIVDIKSEEDFEKYKGKLKGKIVMKRANYSITLRDIPEASRMTEDELHKLEDMMASGDSRFGLPDFLKPYQDMIWGAFRKQRMLSRKLGEFYKKEGVAGVLANAGRGGRHGTVFTSNGNPYKEDAPESIPEFEVLSEHYVRLIKLIDKKKNPVVRFEMTNEVTKGKSMGYNVIGEIPGEGSLEDEVVMLGAHFDSWHASTGATDNAAGSASMMEAVRILQEIYKTTRVKHRRTIRIALWSGEEQGLHGSRGYVKRHVAETVTKDGKSSFKLKDGHENISAYYNIDNGTGKIRGVYLEGNAAIAPIFKAYLEPFHGYGAKTLTMKPTGGTDHMSFNAVGVPGFQFIQDPIEYRTRTHHTNMDNYYRLQAADLKQISTIVATFVHHTAVREEKLPRKVMPKPRRSRW